MEKQLMDENQQPFVQQQLERLFPPTRLGFPYWGMGGIPPPAKNFLIPPPPPFHQIFIPFPPKVNHAPLINKNFQVITQ